MRGNEGRGSWDVAVNLLTARAYAPTVLLPNGTLWILGGLGKKEILKTTELLWVDADGNFKIGPGADMSQVVFGHCAFLHPNGNRVVVAGGFDGTNKYMKYSEEFILSENAWVTKAWSDMKTGLLNNCVICLF